MMDNERERYIRYVIRTRFLKVPRVDTSTLRLTYEGAYSLTPATAAAHMVMLMERTLRRPLRTCRILECFAGHGGDTIPIIHHGEPKVIMCLESNPEHRNNLRHNLRTYFPNAYHRRRVTVPNEGCAITFVHNIQEDLRQGRNPLYDIIYMDPPWGGHSVNKMRDIRLHDKNGQAFNLTDIVHECRNVCRLIVIKLPIGFDAAAFGPKAIVEDYDAAHIRYVMIQC